MTVYKGDVVDHVQVPEVDAYTTELEYFTECVERGDLPRVVTPTDARLSLEVTLGAIRSMEREEVVCIGAGER